MPELPVPMFPVLPPAARLTLCGRSGGQRSKGQSANALAGGREDGIDKRRRHGRKWRLADAARRQVEVVVYQVRADLPRRRTMTQHLIVVEVALLHPTVLEADLAAQRQAQPHDRGPFHLRADALGVDLRTTVE